VGILLVTFGSSKASAQVSFENIDKKTKAAFSDIPVRWAYTSTIIRKKTSQTGQAPGLTGNIPKKGKKMTQWF